jgi:hypothetical protein
MDPEHVIFELLLSFIAGKVAVFRIRIQSGHWIRNPVLGSIPASADTVQYSNVEYSSYKNIHNRAAYAGYGQ